MRIRFYFLALSRLWRSVSFPLLLLVTAAAIFCAPLLGQRESLPSAAVFDADASTLSAQVTERLLQNGFVLCPDEETLRAGVRAGIYDCGVILPAGFGADLRAGQTEMQLTFVTSPTSFVPQLYKNHAAAAVFAVRAPYITADALSHTEITEEEVLAEYGAMMEEGARFTFTLTDGAAEILPEDTRAVTYTTAAAAWMLFALLAGGTADMLRRDSALTARIGADAVLFRILIPGAAVRAVLAAGAAVGSLCLVWAVTGGTFALSLILPVCAYVLLVTAFGIALGALLPEVGQMRVLSCFLMMASLVLCPVYFDSTLTLPWTAFLRPLLPPYWLWIAAENPAACLAVGAAALAAALCLLRLRLCRTAPVK